MRLAPVAFVFAVLAIVPAHAADSASASEQQEQKQKAEKPEKKKVVKICRTVQNTGFRTAARQCKTKEQWDAIDSGAVDQNDVDMKTGRVSAMSGS